MTKFFLSLFIFIISINSFAKGSLSNLAAELLSNNSQILAGKVEVEKAQIDEQLHSAAKNWSLSYDFGYDDSKLESSVFYAASPAKTYAHNLALSKSFYHGGQFSLSNKLTTVTGTNLFTNTNSEVNGFTQSLSYSLDLGENLFGRKTRMEREILEETTLLNKNLSDETTEQQLLNLALGFTQARLSMANENLSSEALERAKKREQLISKRVKDGLKLKVDLYQAEMSTRTQAEALTGARTLTENSYEVIGKLVHRNIDSSDVAAFDLTNVKRETPAKKSGIKNHSLSVLNERLKIIESSMEKASFSKIPAISLNAGYVSNDYNPKLSKALSEGAIGSKANSFQVGINLAWSIGNEPANLSTSKYLIQKTLLRKQKENLVKNISLSENVLKFKIQTLNENLESAKIRKILARKALLEYNNLYNRGRADLDSVIRAEESLISTEKTFVNYLAERDQACYQMAYLYGDLEVYLLKN